MKVFLISHIADADGVMPVILTDLAFENYDYKLLDIKDVDTFMNESIDNNLFEVSAYEKKNAKITDGVKKLLKSDDLVIKKNSKESKDNLFVSEDRRRTFDETVYYNRVPNPDRTTTGLIRIGQTTDPRYS